jgi:hypothetical protein
MLHTYYLPFGEETQLHFMFLHFLHFGALLPHPHVAHITICPFLLDACSHSRVPDLTRHKVSCTNHNAIEQGCPSLGEFYRFPAHPDPLKIAGLAV